MSVAMNEAIDWGEGYMAKWKCYLFTLHGEAREKAGAHAGFGCTNILGAGVIWPCLCYSFCSYGGVSIGSTPTYLDIYMKLHFSHLDEWSFISICSITVALLSEK